MMAGAFVLPRNLCPLCRGSGNLVTFAQGREYWPCSCCGGAGARSMRQAPTFTAMRLV